MPNQSDDPDRPSTLPQAELNPLLNPTLGQHMGRWAEVYFKAPPEQREEAVQQLIRELQDEPLSSSDVPSSEKAAERPVSRQPRASAAGSSASAAPGQGTTCFWCGYVNRPRYKFCGRCGEPLATPAPDWRGQSNDSLVPDLDWRASNSGLDPQATAESNFQSDSNRQPRAFPSMHPASSVEVDEVPRRRRAFDNDEQTIHLTSERSLRPWLATVLAVVVLALAYVAWHGSAASPAAHAVPQSAPSDASTAAPTTASNSEPQNNSQPASPAPVNESPQAASTPPASTVPDPGANVPAPNANTTAPAPAKGSDELAQAQDYLNGANARPRSPELAAQWLWKAVRKENIEATVLLSGMYLRGEGIPKNCDQARLLLDAAALKGRKDAAEELKNLPAFGCQ